MFDFLLDAAFAPFTVALALLVGLLGLELVALLLGGSLMAGDGELDMDVDVAPEIGDLDLDIDVDADAFEIAEVEPDVAPEMATPGPASWLGLGRMPFMIWLAVLLMGFGLSGMGLQIALRNLIGADLPAVWAAIPAGAFGLWFARGFGAVFARLLPKTETEAVSERMLARRRGVITQGTAASRSPGRGARGRPLRELPLPAGRTSAGWRDAGARHRGVGAAQSPKRCICPDRPVRVTARA